MVDRICLEREYGDRMFTRPSTGQKISPARLLLVLGQEYTQTADKFEELVLQPDQWDRLMDDDNL